MEREKFEAAFAEFVGGEVYRNAEQSLYFFARAAFSSGWCAARYPDEPADETETLREI